MSRDALRLYGDLAWLWPLWGDPSGYASWCDAVVASIRRHSLIEARSLLNMACGGGKSAFNLKRHFEVTGIDISQPMLDLARKLNPDCTFLQADMLACSLDRQFDSIFIDDGISGMPQPDLAAAFRTAFAHLRPGGVMVVDPADVIPDFEQNATRVTHASSRFKPDNIDVVFIENGYDPDPTDDTWEFTIVYLIREDGKLRVEVDREIETFVPMEVWRTTIREAGFDIRQESYLEKGKPEPLFACVKPKEGEGDGSPGR